jgi:hypothetical protein
MSAQSVTGRVPGTTHTTVDAPELARAYHRAREQAGGLDRLAVDRVPESIHALAGAVRAFVHAERTDGAPPERVLATMKRVLRPSDSPAVDERHGERLQAVVMREFLASYYAAPAPVAQLTASID